MRHELKRGDQDITKVASFGKRCGPWEDAREINARIDVRQSAIDVLGVAYLRL